MLFVPAESQVLLSALADGTEGDFEYCEFGGFIGKVAITATKFTVTLSHPSIGAIDTRLRGKYSFVDELTASSGVLKLVCPLEAARKHASEIARLRRNILASPIEEAIANQEQGRPTAKHRTVLKASSKECMWVVGHPDRLFVINSMRLEEEAEQSLSATFLKELVDTRGLPGYQSAPSVSVSQELPVELVGEEHLSGHIYITFVLFARNLEPAKRAKAIDRMVHLREYYYAHLRAAKMYLHSRMRAKTQDMAGAIKGMSLKRSVPQSKTFRYPMSLCV